MALPVITNLFQGASVKDRQIMDGVLIANELMDSKKRSGKEGVIFKFFFF